MEVVVIETRLVSMTSAMEVEMLVDTTICMIPRDRLAMALLVMVYEDRRRTG